MQIKSLLAIFEPCPGRPGSVTKAEKRKDVCLVNYMIEKDAERAVIAGKIEIGREMLYLTRQDLGDIGLTVQEIITLTREALLAHGRGQYEMPAKIGVHPYRDGFFHAMPAYVSTKNAVGIKWIESYPSNPDDFCLPQTTGLMIINDIPTGCPLAMMDATLITAVRTPAVTALAAGALHPSAATFGMYGCGVQGTEHCRYIVHTLPELEKIYVFDRYPAAADKLIETVQPEIDVEIVRGESPEMVAKSCEALSSATVINRVPLAVIEDSWISPGQTLLPCDLNTYFDPATLKRADKYIVDSEESHRLFTEMGYFPGGLPEVSGETGAVLAGISRGRENDSELIVCSNIGMAVCDVVVGKELMMRALDQGRGRILPL